MPKEKKRSNHNKRKKVKKSKHKDVKTEMKPTEGKMEEGKPTEEIIEEHIKPTEIEEENPTEEEVILTKIEEEINYTENEEENAVYYETEMFDEIYTKLLKSITTKKINVSDLIYITTNAMVIVQKYPNLSGSQKKQITIELLQKLVDKSNLIPEEHEAATMIFMESILPSLIDKIVDSYQHKIDLKKIGKKILAYFLKFRCCCCCCKN